MHVHINYEHIINILYHDKLDVSEGIDVNKIRDIKRVWYLPLLLFLNKGFKFLSYVIDDMIL